MTTVKISMADLDEGESTGIKVDGMDVLVCHVEGQFYALHAQCSHARQSLVKGKLRGFQLVCPLHGARFDVRTGACSAGPAQEPIKSFPVTMEAGRVCIDVSKL